MLNAIINLTYLKSILKYDNYFFILQQSEFDPENIFNCYEYSTMQKSLIILK